MSIKSEEEAAAANAADERETLEQYVRELRSRLQSRDQYRQKHAALFQRQASDLQSGRLVAKDSKLDSSVKKNTTFVKKLKVFSASQLDALLNDLRTLNCSKYVSEVAAAIVDAKLKMTDIEAAVRFSSEITELYPEFSQHFLESWQKVLAIKSSTGEKIANTSKLRIDLRFYAELVAIGLFNNTKSALNLLGNVLTSLIAMDKEDHVNFSIILTFCKFCGEDFAAIVPRKIRQLSDKFHVEIPRSKFLSIEKQIIVQNLIKDYYQSMCKHLKVSQSELRDYDKQNSRILQTKGELNADRKEHYEQLQNAYEKLSNAVQNFAELLDVEAPQLQLASASVVKEDSAEVLASEAASTENSVESQIWPDSEMRSFYTELINYRDYLPANHNLLLALNKRMAAAAAATASTPGAAAATPAVPAAASTATDDDVSTVSADEEDSAGGSGGGGGDEPDEASGPGTPTLPPTAAPFANGKLLFDTFLNSLPNCISRELIDNAAVHFIMSFNTRTTRKKIARILFGVNRTRLDLLPFYARFTANVSQLLPEIGHELSQMLRVDFRYHVKKRDQINFESKIKAVRFIGEMVKFQMYSTNEALHCLKVLLNNFNHHQIEMTCNLLEVCGRYLYVTADSHQQTKVYVEQMMRKKAVMSLDMRYVLQIENAYYQVHPPETATAIPQKERPVLHQFLRRILFDLLNRQNIAETVTLLRKFDWNDEEFACYGAKCLMSAHKVKYLNIPYLASTLAAFGAHNEPTMIAVIDRLFEDVRLGLETNLTRFNQRRIAQVTYLAELFNCSLINSPELFKVLYLLITFGVGQAGAESVYDPVDNLFRIKLVCVILERTTKKLLGSGAGMSPAFAVDCRKRVDCFLVFFQAYYLFKKCDPFWTKNGPFPIYVQYSFEDTVLQLRPKFKFARSYEKALQEIEKVKKNLGINAFLEKLNRQLDAKAEKEAAAAVAAVAAVASATSTAATVPDDQNELVYGLEIISESEEEPSSAPNGAKRDMETVLEAEPDGDYDDDDTATSAAVPGAAEKPRPNGATTEDEEFIASFDRMLTENMQERMKVNVKAKNVDISIPRNLKSTKKSSYSQLHELSSLQSAPGCGSQSPPLSPPPPHQHQHPPSSSAPTPAPNKMDFVLIVRKGNKSKLCSFQADLDSDLARNLKNRELAEREEKQHVKQLTLNITERLEEEDYREMLLQAQQRQYENNSNREKKKYQHPKGAPDADLIFGSKC